MQIFNLRENKQAFSLIEILVATLILGSALVAMVYGLTQSSKLSKTISNQNTALNAAQEQLAEIANNVNQVTSYDQTTFAVSGLLPPEGKSDAGAITVAQVGTTKLYDVTITVSWQQSDGQELSKELNVTLVQR